MIEVAAHVEDAEIPFLSAPGPYRSGRKRVLQPIICQNFVLDRIGEKPKVNDIGDVDPVSSMSTETDLQH